MKTLIIAEAGVNHNGDLKKAFQLIDVAEKAGADYVKFQTFKAEKLVQKNAEKAAYQKRNTSGGESQYDMLKKLELSRRDHEEITKYCSTKNVNFLSTAFDLESLSYLKDIIDVYKVPSGEITNLPYLEAVARTGLPVIMSTGMAEMQEVKNAFSVLVENGVPVENVTILHCNTDYPTAMKDVNLLAMLSIKKELGTPIGYSDHTLGIEIPIAAVALGATVIEKHFTLDRNLPGPDHKASLEPDELLAMVSSIRNIEVALGDGVKRPSKSEAKNKEVARKSIVALTSIKEGESFTTSNIGIKRPGTGISPMKWYEILGSPAKRDYDEDELI